MDMQLAEQLKNKIEEVTEDIDIEIDLLPPSLPSITLPSSSYSFLIHQSISFTIDMNGVMNCHITPSLPQGLILNRTTCTISGTLTSLSFSSYNITAISHSNTFIRIVSIEIISSLISYPQTNLIIGQGLSFSITPNLTKVSTISIVSGSLPIGLSINPSTGVISGSPSQLLSSQSVTIEAMSGTAIQTVVLSFTVITPISSFINGKHIWNASILHSSHKHHHSSIQSSRINSIHNLHSSHYSSIQSSLFSILIHSHQRTIILNLSNHFRRQSSIHNHFRNSSSWSISQSINWNHFWYSFIYIPIYIYHYSGFQSTRIHSNSTILYCQRSIHSHYHSHLSFYSYHSHYSYHHHSHHSIKEEETYSTKEVNRRSEIC